MSHDYHIQQNGEGKFLLSEVPKKTGGGDSVFIVMVEWTMFGGQSRLLSTTTRLLKSGSTAALFSIYFVVGPSCKFANFPSVLCHFAELNAKAKNLHFGAKDAMNVVTFAKTLPQYTSRRNHDARFDS